MLLHIALVSKTSQVALAQLAPVAAAIQKQVSRDFGPIWRIEATVNAFDKLEDVPVGYWHVVLVDETPNGAAGLHKRDDNKQPFALVGLTLNWTVFMSHEVLEMLVDPQGTLTRAGNSLGVTSAPAMLVVREGEMVFTPALVEHAVEFPEDTVFLNITGKTREQKVRRLTQERKSSHR